MIEDYIVAGASIAISYALIPQVYKGFKEKQPNVSKQTGIITTTSLYAMAGSFLSADLNYSAITSAIAGTEWAILTAQSFMYRKKFGGLEKKLEDCTEARIDDTNKKSVKYALLSYVNKILGK